MSDSTESSAYFCRVISLVVDVGTESLRDIFYWKVPKLNVATLFATPEVQSEFKRLKGKKALTEVQYAKVKNNPDPDTYDISLLTTLLTSQKICGISKPKDGWGKVPDASDISLGADLLRLREIINEIIAHGSKAQLEITDFKKIWGNVEIVLERLAAHIDASEKVKVKEKINNALTRVLEPLDHREKNMLKVFIEWQKEDNKKNEEQLSDISNKLENLHLKFDSLQTPADETDAASSNVTSEDALSSIQSQVSSLAESLGSIARQDDVNQVQANMNRMEDNVKAISELVKILKEKVEKSNHNLEELSKNAQLQISANAETKTTTVERIQKLTFSRTGYDQGDVFHDRPESGASYRPAGPPAGPSFNVFGGDVRIEGLGIHQPQSSSSSDVASDSLDGSGSRDTSFSGSFNIHGGKVEIKNMAMGPATQFSSFQNCSQFPAVREEKQSIEPNFGRPPQGSSQSSGQPFKKENDDTPDTSLDWKLREKDFSLQEK